MEQEAELLVNVGLTHSGQNSEFSAMLKQIKERSILSPSLIRPFIHLETSHDFNLLI